MIKDKNVVAQLIRRAERAGFKAIALTVDTPRLGRREADIKNRHLAEQANQSLNWKDVKWLQTITHLPILLKGVLTADDGKQDSDKMSSLFLLEGLLHPDPSPNSPDPVTALLEPSPSSPAMESDLSVMEAMHAPIFFERYDVHGDMKSVPSEVIESIRKNKTCLKGRLKTPIGGGVSPLNVQLRKELDRYASPVNCFNLPGLPTSHLDVDIVVVRENTEGDYSGLEHEVLESLKVLPSYYYYNLIVDYQVVSLHTYLFTEILQNCQNHDVTERELFGRRVEERETLVFSGELVGVVDAMVAGGVEGGLVGGAKHRCFVFVTDIAWDLHLGCFSRLNRNDFTKSITKDDNGREEFSKKEGKQLSEGKERELSNDERDEEKIRRERWKNSEKSSEERGRNSKESNEERGREDSKKKEEAYLVDCGFKFRNLLLKFALIARYASLLRCLFTPDFAFKLRKIASNLDRIVAIQKRSHGSQRPYYDPTTILTWSRSKVRVRSNAVMTKFCSERIARYSFEYAYLNNRKKVTAVHKANIMKLADGLFLESCREVASKYPGIKYNEIIVDNCCMQLVSKPEQFDVMVTPNLYGNLVANTAAGIAGGTGVMPGGALAGNVGNEKILEQNKANPVALLLSSAMMLRHLQFPSFTDRLETSMKRVISEGRYRTKDLGGDSTPQEVVDAIIANLD
ncbi:hypothetical protein TEA_026248 [Camellia sinensis var. sinensis]|uniref:FMN hydroxy acid dehydrogenase domain-containing protein n=1 Tax=Camellia sinensis var. sinensis TaxID=542762 RepID=A0A4S4DJI4_CAMSN|nr:hypothetical protein TEA_026248 [Camellia sinensis var. sinensis]